MFRLEVLKNYPHKQRNKIKFLITNESNQTQQELHIWVTIRNNKCYCRTTYRGAINPLTFKTKVIYT